MNEIEKIAHALLVKDFELPLANTFHEVEAALQSHIVWLLHHQMETLLQALYKIDVDEKKVKEVFALNDPKAIAPALTRLIISRMIQKAETRMKYRSNV